MGDRWLMLYFALLLTAMAVMTHFRDQLSGHHYLVYVNESPVFDTRDGAEEQRVLSLLERSIYLTKGTGVVQINVDGKPTKREYREGRLCCVPGGILSIDVKDGVSAKEKVN